MPRRGEASSQGDANIAGRVKFRHRQRQKIPLNKCTVCVKIMKCLQNPMQDRREKLGSWKDVILSTSCNAHQEFLLHCIRVPTGENRFEDLCLFIHTSERSSGVAIFGHSNNSIRAWSNKLCLIRHKDTLDKLGRASRLHEQWIDHSLPGRWKSQCDRLHGRDCHRFPGAARLPSTGPAFLVDTWLKCIVRAEPTMDYVALSYVWGSESSLMTQQNNVSLLQKPGALTTSININSTILMAMEVVCLLKERYLWVDQLCIIQDDDDFKHTEIRNMSMIYASATVTIVASNSSSCGIAGLHGISNPREKAQVIYKFRNTEITELASIRSYHDRSKEASLWPTRGWTFQEQLLSHRRLIFHNGLMRWECKSAIWFEDLSVAETAYIVANSINEWASIFTYRIPNVTGLSFLLSHYAQRDLTYQEDTLFACSGLLNVLSTSYSGGFISGLPRAFFDSALLWLFSRSAQRRKAKTGASETTCLPSWSWAGWKGEFSPLNWNGEDDFVKRTPYFERPPGKPNYPVQSCVQWYSLASRSSEPQVIECDWRIHKQRYLNTDALPPPAGWKRYNINSSGVDYSCDRDKLPVNARGMVPKFIYKHESCNASEFWYPVPLLERAQVAEADSHVRFITCKTQRVHLTGGKHLFHYRSIIFLLDSHGKRIGSLHLTEESQTSPEGDEQMQHALDGKQLELVRIVEGRYERDGYPRNHSIAELDWEGWPMPEEGLYEFYHVLWIEWEDGVAYRKGLGQVIKPAWEEQDPEEIDLLLG